MASFSKLVTKTMFDNQNTLEIIDKILYFFNILCCKSLILKLAMLILKLNKSHFTKYIKNNLDFSEFLIDSEHVVLTSNSKITFKVLYEFLVEKFYDIFTYEDRDLTSNDILKCYIIICNYAEKQGYKNYAKGSIEDYVLLIREKNPEILVFQFEYFIQDILFTEICKFKLISRQLTTSYISTSRKNVNHEQFIINVNIVFQNKPINDKITSQLVSYLLTKTFIDYTFYYRNNDEVIQWYNEETDIKKKWRILMKKY